VLSMFAEADFAVHGRSKFIAQTRYYWTSMYGVAQAF